MKKYFLISLLFVTPATQHLFAMEQPESTVGAGMEQPESTVGAGVEELGLSSDSESDSSSDSDNNASNNYEDILKTILNNGMLKDALEDIIEDLQIALASSSDSEGDSSSESEEEIAYTENQKQHMAFCSAIMYGKARVNSDRRIMFSHSETHENYQINIDTAHRHFEEAKSQVKDNKSSVTNLVSQGLMHFFTDAKWDLPIDIRELNNRLEQQKKKCEDLKLTNLMLQSPVFNVLDAVCPGRASSRLEQGEVEKAVIKNWSEMEPVYEYFERCNNREQVYVEMKKELQGNRAQVLNALTEKN